jgi:hypothetical protein
MFVQHEGRMQLRAKIRGSCLALEYNTAYAVCGHMSGT